VKFCEPEKGGPWRVFGLSFDPRVLSVRQGGGS